MAIKSSIKHQPLLTRYAVERIGGSDIPGCFSKEKDVWTINSGGIEVPIIRSHGLLSELTTKTHNYNEQDDEFPFVGQELLTKTDVQIERDDSDISNDDHMTLLAEININNNESSSGLKETLTKTEVNAESADDPCVNHIIELLTKTKVEVESDDEDFFIN